ncbi:GNAT family N-acetyltransferase [Halobacillus mangrovi]|uniref:GNAT family N-acetyltransferase n=1 Tax=Halobacillus mangrovi TaxID=402384 RepID=UPI003D961C14
MRIREASPEETGCLSEIAIQSKAYWGYDDWFLNTCKSDLTLTAHYIKQNPTYVIESDNKIHGFYSILLVKHRLDHFFISPEAIGQGYGRRLWQHMVELCKIWNLSSLTIESDPHAEDFYYKMGTNRIGETESSVFPSRSLPLLEVTFEHDHSFRNEETMMELILQYGKHHELIRGAIMNGSRVNPNVNPDRFQDYDIVYFVADVQPFKYEKNVLPHFGEVMLIEKPEDKILPEPLGDGRFTYLIQFMDGNRIDVHFVLVEKMDVVLDDSLTEILIDKDHIFPNLPAPSERSYWIKPPNEKLYQDCCNSFIWGLGSHIPKTVWRKELPLLMTLIEVVLREPLIQMLKWKIGLEKGYRISIGKAGKNLEQWVEPELWSKFTDTYPDSNYDRIWNSLFTFHDLFLETALEVGRAHGYPFPKEEMDRAKKFLNNVSRTVNKSP